MIKGGYLYQGQYYTWQQKRRGTPAHDLPPAAFVLFIENHDQIANSCCGYRVHRRTSAALVRAMTALLLLAPGTPMLFQGQEFASSAPFLYFADLPADLGEAVSAGRKEFLSQFPSLAGPDFLAILPDSASRSTFLRCKLDLSERTSHRDVYDLHKDLLKLRREDAVFHAQKRGAVDGAVLAKDAFLLRFFGQGGNDRLVTVNFGIDLLLAPAPEPMLAPPEGREWRLSFSSEDYRYGGFGTPPMNTGTTWTIPGRSTLVFIPEAEREGEKNHE
jgi:maltooligosyltrehalose trehalohydrolase